MRKEEYVRFIQNSVDLLTDYEKRERYFHTLCPSDNSPTVVHLKTNQYTQIISGTGSVFLNGVEQKITAGDGFFIEAGMHHRFIAESEEMMLFHIHIPDEGRDLDRHIVEGDDYDRYEI